MSPEAEPDGTPVVPWGTAVTNRCRRSHAESEVCAEIDAKWPFTLISARTLS